MNKKELLQKLSCTKVDINKSVHSQGDFDLADKFGTKFKFNNLEGFLGQLKTFGCDITGIVFKKPEWIIELDAAEASEKVVEAVVDETEQVVQEDEEIFVEDFVEASVVEDKPTVDWKWVESLDDNKESKAALDEYAAKFEVSLKRNMKLENMIKAFKEAMDV